MKVLVATLFLGAFGPGLARAECAWVLWERYEFVNLDPAKPVDRGNWQILAAMPTYEACNNAARERAQRNSETTPEAVNVKAIRVNQLIGGGFAVWTEFKKPEHSSSNVEFKCFPDNVRP